MRIEQMKNGVGHYIGKKTYWEGKQGLKNVVCAEYCFWRIKLKGWSEGGVLKMSPVIEKPAFYAKELVLSSLDSGNHQSMFTKEGAWPEWNLKSEEGCVAWKGNAWEAS